MTVRIEVELDQHEAYALAAWAAVEALTDSGSPLHRAIVTVGDEARTALTHLRAGA